ncbi:uncharacterized protein RCO7_09959 [Rhynchosporium graminicola]|uniref:BTB domain-containing protein n=1 Tax=Rhynchosporium graminicola TaxID=2792576 RepID=A0A1E1LL85_9HELO|nr:uncharacterized protein RCO7_09959 [Rhynchosporium commune]
MASDSNNVAAMSNMSITIHTRTPNSVQSTKSFDGFFTSEGGDVEIRAIFQGHQVNGKVASQVMVLACPFWKKFIYPLWTTSDSVQPMTIDFTEDDGCALKILLRATHLQSNSVPVTPRVDTLFQLAMLYSAKWLYIAWAFGNAGLYMDITLKMAISYSDTIASSIDGSGIKVWGYMPDKSLDLMKQASNYTIKRVLDVIYNEAKKYSDGYKSAVC